MRKFIQSLVVALGLLGASTATFAQAGRLDPTFGNGGIVQTNFGQGNTFFSSGAALAPNGDVIVSGDIQSSVEIAALVRYLPDGALDSSFGGNGIVTLPPPVQFQPGTSFASGITVQPDGKLLVLFGAFNSSGTAAENLLLRLNSNGQADTTFGSGGQIPLNFPIPANYSATNINLVQVQSDGKILLAGVVLPPSRSKLPLLTLLARYLPNGAPDASFGSAGVSEVIAIGDATAVSFSGSNILAGDYRGQIAEFSSSGALLWVSPQEPLLVNIGQPTTFDANGDLLVGSNIAGPFKNNQDAVVSRYNRSGLDSSFHSGVIRLGPDGPFVHNVPVGIGVDANGRIAVGVELQTRTGNTSGVARLNADGSLDTTFGGNGVGTTVPGMQATTILVQPNNEIISIGGGTLARYLAQ